MFSHTELFNCDISKWDVSRVTDMTHMFSYVEVFNRDISKWDVSCVTSMDYMFLHAAPFKQKLCGHTWVRSRATKKDMFAASPGSISRTVCTSGTMQHADRFVSRRPITDRELIVRSPIRTAVNTSFIPPTIAQTLTCPKCGTFQKSGRASCCAPGGAWFKNCGGFGNKNVDRR